MIETVEETRAAVHAAVAKEKNYGPFKMFVWRRQPDWIAVAHATSVESARVQILDEIGGGADPSTPIRLKAIEAIEETNPVIFYRDNAEFELTSSANLEEADLTIGDLRKQVKGLVEDLSEAKTELEDDDRLRGKLDKILTNTANALHGGPLENGLWSFHDLATIATAQRRALNAAYHALRSYQHGNDSKELAEEVADACEKVLNPGKSPKP